MMQHSKALKMRRSGLAALGLGISATLMLTGCSASYWPDFSPEVVEVETPAESSHVAPVPVNDAQIESIIRGVSRVSAVGDDTLDAAELSSRFAGDALTQRTANYKIRGAVDSYASIPAVITDERLGYQLVQSTESWPRTLLVTVASEAAETEGEGASAPSIALILTQQIPQENFQVTRAISLRGGIEMPKAAPADEGTALLSDDIDSFVLQPGQVGAQYAAILQGGIEVPEAAAFELENDPLIENYGLAWAADAKQKAEAEEKTMTYSVSVKQSDSQIVSMSTGVGGALVATTLIEEQVLDSAGGRWKPQAEGAVAALSGLSGQQERIVRQVAHQLLFFVPSKEDGSKIQLLGVTSELVGASN